MFDCIALELRKNRLPFIGLAATFGLSLPFAAWIAGRADYPLADAMNATFLFWTFCGLPLAAGLLGATGGAGLRSEPARSAESLLPLSPGRRVGGALAAAGLHLALLAGVALLVAFDASADWRDVFLEGSLSNAFIEPMFGMLAFGLGDIVLLSFAWAYWSRHGTLGGLVGVIIGSGTAAALGVGFALEMVFGSWAPFLWRARAAEALALGAGFAVLLRLSAKTERGVPLGYVKGVAAGVALFLGGAAAFGTLVWTYDDLIHGLYEAPTWDRYGYAFPRFVLEKSSGEGAALANLRGDLFWVSQDGRRTPLIRSEDKSIRDVVGLYWRSHIKSMVRDHDGVLWVLRSPARHEFRAYEVWFGRPGAPLTLRSAFSTDHWDVHLLPVPGGPPRVVAKSELRRWVAPIPEARRPLRWSPFDERAVSAELRRAGLTARLDGRSTLVQKSRHGEKHWRLPGPALIPGDYPAFQIGGKTMFLVPVSLSGGRGALAACSPDGRVKLPWPVSMRQVSKHGGLDWRINPDGSVWRDAGGMLLHVATREGEFLQALRVDRLLDQIKNDRPSSRSLQVLHAEGGHVWILVGGRLLVEADGRRGEVVHWRRLSGEAHVHGLFDTFGAVASSDWAIASRGGFFLHSSRGFQFVRWDGSFKALGRP